MGVLLIQQKHKLLCNIMTSLFDFILILLWLYVFLIFLLYSYSIKNLYTKNVFGG